MRGPKRIIFSLLYADGFFHLSRNFRLQRVGDLRWLLDKFRFKSITNYIDELIIINVGGSSSGHDFDSFSKIVSELSAIHMVPITAGGGVRSYHDAKLLMDMGADKVLVNSDAFRHKIWIEDFSGDYGAQALVLSVDVLHSESGYEIYIDCGTERFGELRNLSRAINLSLFGDICLRSINRDGTGFGLDHCLYAELTSDITNPIILCGGLGNYKHLVESFNRKMLSSVATANLFNFMGDSLKNLRENTGESVPDLQTWKNVEDVSIAR